MGLFKKILWRAIPLGIPLSWLQLTGEKKRFYVALAGITFAVAMMLFQMGLRAALFKQVIAPIALLNADLVVVGSHYEYFGVGRGFPDIRLDQAYALDSVEYATPLKLGTMSFKNVDTGQERDIFAIAYDPSKKTFLPKDINSGNEALKKRGSILFDKLSREQYGEVERAFLKNPHLETEVGGKRVKIEGLVEIGATFAADGNVLMSIQTFDEMWSAPKCVVNVGVIKLKDGFDAKEEVQKLKKILPSDVSVMTKQQFIDKERDYWDKRTPIGFVISASMAVAIFVGAIIVYQILYTDVTDHLPEYATLKAIGFDDKFFISVIFQESLILSVLGFIPGSAIAALLYYATREIANMPTYLTFTNLSIVFLLTVFMCASAGLLATRKLRAANPADIF
ncbi:ABC transporter permease DevC [Intestinicryptomonas porci]|uniref:ABC transporter permease DevC n=1 Tax=Intestinicryptomonas porci TaxID=2926320 RepID=A0ABU4WHW5_9BACT|nr:ABC transporter permease DevC [Opitutales bacterium CLA-KB-P66]